MKTSMPPRVSPRGFSLIEIIIAMGVLAVALPLVCAVMARSGQSSASAKAETHCVWILPACLHEIDAAFLGKSHYLPTLARGQSLPAAGDILALAYSKEGRALALVTREAYHMGINPLAGDAVAYIVSICGEPSPTQASRPSMCNLRLTLEYPPAAPAVKRQKLDFFTRIP